MSANDFDLFAQAAATLPSTSLRKTYSAINYGLIGASLINRCFVHRAVGGPQVAREREEIVLRFAHGVSPGEFMSVRSRLPGLSSQMAIPRIVSPTELRLPALLDGFPDGQHPTTSGAVAFLTNVSYLSRYDLPGSWIRVASLHPNVSGRLRLLRMLAQGGDNEPEIATKFATGEVEEACAALAALNGIMIGNLGGDLASWTFSNPLNIPRIRRMTALCPYISTEGSANNPNSATQDDEARVALVQTARLLGEQEMQINPGLLIFNQNQILLDPANPNSAARQGLHCDDVHWNQGGSYLIGAQFGALLSSLLSPFQRQMVAGQQDQWTTGLCPIGANVAVGMNAGSPTVALAFASGQPGSGVVSGNVDAMVGQLRRTGTAAVTVASEIVDYGGERTMTFTLSKAATGNSAIDIPLTGPDGSEWWRRMSPGFYEIAIDYEFLDAVRVQAFEIFVDSGNGTNRMGAFSAFESDSYETLLTTSEMVYPEGGKAWFPTPVQWLGTEGNFRLVLRTTFVNGVAGSCKAKVRKVMVRRVR